MVTGCNHSLTEAGFKIERLGQNAIPNHEKLLLLSGRMLKSEHIFP